MPHSTIRTGRNPRRWTTKDRSLALALTIHEDGLCAKCGHPRDRSWNEDMDGYYTAHRATCQGCVAAHNEQETRTLRAAETVYVTDDAPAGFTPDPRMLDR